RPRGSSVGSWAARSSCGTAASTCRPGLGSGSSSTTSASTRCASPERQQVARPPEMSKQAPVENVNRVPLLAGDGDDVDDPAVLVRLHLRQRCVMSTRGRSTRVRHSCLMRRAFMQVDVFTSEAYGGNPVAVVLEADGL